MRDYWLTRELLSIAGWGYLLLAAIAIGLAVWLPKQRKDKLIAGLIALGLFSILPIQATKQFTQEKQAQVDASARLRQAQALFEKRCETAGEKIYKTVENVEGVLLMRVRPDKVNFSDQYAMDDPYGRDVGGNGYIGSFLRPSAGAALNPRVAEGRRLGFSYVEAVDIRDNKLYRYIGVIKAVNGRDPNFELEVVEVAHPSARYGVTYEDISTHEDRDSWIAGGLLKVLDLQTKAVVAERRGYIFDQRLGDTTGGRGPWEAAVACQGAERNYGHNARFVLKTLNPTEVK